ncbi:MAG TPA: hypothetical protein DCZ95_19005 [Verrucomicrobia bacterium]|nr:hypothetical protein [Verrucomicrobiota bacterium]
MNNKALYIALLVIGVVLLLFGISSWQSFSSDVSSAVSGTPTNRAIWLLIGGILLGVIGLVGTLSGRHGHHV